MAVTLHYKVTHVKSAYFVQTWLASYDYSHQPKLDGHVKSAPFWSVMFWMARQPSRWNQPHVTSIRFDTFSTNFAVRSLINEVLFLVGYHLLRERRRYATPSKARSGHGQDFGMSTGRANRASVLTSACLRASGASPRHSAIHARVAQREPAALYPASH